MFNFFKKKTNASSNILIECYEDVVYIAGVKIEFPTHLNTLISIFGEPTKQEHDLLWRVVWDDLGIYTEYAAWDTILDVKFLYTNSHKLKHFPKSFFKGRILVDSLEILLGDFQIKELTKNKIQQLTYKGQTEPYCIAIGKNFNYKEIIEVDKYVIKDLEEEVLTFKDFGFKLCIIQELMYQKKLLQPKFELYDFIKWYSKRTIDIEKEGYEPIAEVTQYFRDLPIPKRLASEVTEIYQDGGNTIYLQLLRFGEGWEDYWDIETAEDAKQFPNLKKAALGYAKENVVNELNAMEIEATFI
ncbi:MAG: hypothetical protein AB8B52_08880 [Winogradskyella sp.]|uniref:DUF6892 domain-containing protein n=1 Tax=Winogradskyella sp. TaxID=1883156 RepID=UPI00385BD062